MADRVQYILDRISPTLRRLEELKLFTPAEIKSIVKRRTDYEYVLRRRQLTPADFYGYIQYELNLNKLLVMRCEFNKVDKEKGDAYRVVEGACQRHISYIFDRAIRRFPSEIGLWSDYIKFLKEKNLIKALNAIFGRALSLNPKNENMWLQAAVHELSVNHNLHSARTLLQRSLRANKYSQKLWKKYFELELWSAVRITERQRVLGLGVDNSPIQGAPLVVFKHALISLPSDVDFACELHKSSMTVSASLAESLEKMLLQSFGDKCQSWSYLAGLSFDKHSIQLEESKSLSAADAGSEDKKRKRGEAAAGDIIMHVSKSLDSCTGVLHRAGTLYKAGELESSSDMLESLRYPTMVMSAVQAALEKAGTFISMISSESFKSSAAAAASGSGSAESSSSNSKKKAKSDARTAEAAAPSSSHDTARAVSRLLESLNKLQDLITEVTQHVDEIAGDSGQAVQAGPSSKHSSSLVYSALSTLAAHRLMLLRSVIAPAVTVNQSESGDIDARKLIGWCVDATISLKALFRSRNTAIQTSEKQISESLAAWVEVANAALVSSVRCWALCCALPHTDSTDTLSMSYATETLRQAGMMVAAASPLICSTSSGSDFLQRSFEVLASAGYESQVEQSLRCIVSSPHCSKGTRGTWCAQLVKFAVSQCDDDAKVSPQQLIDDDSDSDSVGPEVHSRRKFMSEDVYRFLENIFHSKPELLVDAEVHHMYEVVLYLEMKAVSALPVKDRDYSHVRGVADRAIENCPAVPSFWETCEEICRAQGKHEEANHIRWRRGKEGAKK